MKRSDGTHRPHFDRYDAFGNETCVWWDEDLPHREALSKAIADMKRNWHRYRREYYGGLK